MNNFKNAINTYAEFHGKINVSYIYFSNNPEQCLINVRNRNDGRKVNGFILTYAKYYNIPFGATVVDVYDANSIQHKYKNCIFNIVKVIKKTYNNMLVAIRNSGKKQSS